MSGPETRPGDPELPSSAVQRFDELSEEAARAALLRCCGSSTWAEAMCRARPFFEESRLFRLAERFWFSLRSEDWLEAFAGHPKIGDVSHLRERFAGTASWSEGEQAGVSRADEATIEGLAKGNGAYEKKFGYIFIVCATGKSADEMLALLEERLTNSPEAELFVAAGEQEKIIRLRLEKLLKEI